MAVEFQAGTFARLSHGRRGINVSKMAQTRGIYRLSVSDYMGPRSGTGYNGRQLIRLGGSSYLKRTIEGSEVFPLAYLEIF